VPLFSADLLIPVGSDPIVNGWVQTDDIGTILETGSGKAPGNATVLKGIVVPGFVNAHCHIELSYLRQRITKKSGMTGFIRQLMSIRNNTNEAVQKMGITEACEEMLRNGIVAVGDISNSSNSAAVKNESPLLFHTFLEVAGLADVKAESILSNAREMTHAFRGKNQKIGLTPHAPYSVSNRLMQQVIEQIEKSGSPLSIHLQESEDELEFCSTGSGPMAEFFNESGFDFSKFSFSKDAPIRKLIPLFQNIQQVVLVHNTFTTTDDIRWAESMHHGIFWCLCPKANLYITGKLPPVSELFHHAKNIVVGTDSLASNDSLDILSELKVIAKTYPEIPFVELIKWVTLQGARALQLENQFGSIEAGKKPGLLLVENIQADNPVITSATSVRRII
jgi:cytosine/adenosine deaminase-related metal-dependent hydrolase